MSPGNREVQGSGGWPGARRRAGAAMLGGEMINEAFREMTLVIAADGPAAGPDRTRPPEVPA